MTFADDILDGLGPAFNRLAGDQLQPLVTALTADAETAAAAMSPTEDLWPALFDLHETTSPAWLAQLAGVQVDPTLSIARQRELIIDRPEWATGTYRGLVATLRTVMTGQRRVFVAERDLSPWHATITVHVSDFADGVTPESLEALAETHRPAGMTFTYVYLAATSYGAAELDAGTYAEAEATAGTYADAEN